MATNVAMLSIAKALNWTYGPDCMYFRKGRSYVNQYFDVPESFDFAILENKVHLQQSEP